MKKAIVTLIGLCGIWVPACSSSDDAECNVAGLYTATGVRESGDCEIPKGPVTDVFEVNNDGTATLTIQGATGSCTGKLQQCNWTASCELRVLDALDPANSRGTAQYSFTFTKTGFTGTSSVSAPPAKSLPDGCRATTKVTGTKR